VIALTRDVPASFATALQAVPAPIDVALSRRQHAAYRAALASLGAEIVALPADDALPDCCFVEDTAVIAGDLAVITRPGAPSRRGETAAIAAALGARMPVVTLREPATLDGGDCMRVGAAIYVGRSPRTNPAGIAALAEAVASRGIAVVAVDLPPHTLHLKCVCTPLGDGRITLADDTIPASSFAAHVVRIPADEAYAANVLAVGDAVIVADGFPRTAAALAAAGFRVLPIATTEFRKADGSLTCLSILCGRAEKL
jgi:dimethylargininase